MKGSEFHKEMETGEVQGRNISRKGGHALALAHELVSLSWQKLDAIYSFFFVPPLGNQVLARENRRLCSKFHILCFQTYTIFKAQALLNIAQYCMLACNRHVMSLHYCKMTSLLNL